MLTNLRNQEIPSVNLGQMQHKAFGFRIASNREILLYDELDHNPFRPHRIQYYAVLFILEGEGNHYIDFKTYHYQRNSIIFVSKEQVHAFERNLNRDAFFLMFTEEFLEKGSSASNLMQELSLYNYHLYPPVIQLQEKQTALLRQLSEGMRNESDAPSDVLTEEIVHATLIIFLCLAERIRKENRKLVPRSKYHEEYVQFQKLLNKHIFESRQVKYYADTLLISTKKLNRITQEMLGKPAKSYINEFLVIEIKRLLMNTSFTIKEIAYQTGFEEVTNFVKYFKKHSGFNPTEFRKSY